MMDHTLAVSLSGDGMVVAVGAPGKYGAGWADDEWAVDDDAKGGYVRVYVWTIDEWVQRGADVAGEARFDRLGDYGAVALSFDGTVLAAGATHNDGNGNAAGHARVFAWDSVDEKWVQRGDDIDGEAAGDSCGRVSISSDGMVLAVGAGDNDFSGDNAGHARVFEWTGLVWSQRVDTINGEAAGDFAGNYVSISADGTALAVGATGNDRNGALSGHARVFTWGGDTGAVVDEDSGFEGDGDKPARARCGKKTKKRKCKKSPLCRWRRGKCKKKKQAERPPWEHGES